MEELEKTVDETEAVSRNILKYTASSLRSNLQYQYKSTIRATCCYVLYVNIDFHLQNGL